jgi:excisionase family DNA binding protein
MTSNLRTAAAYSVAEVQALLGLSRSTVMKLIGDGELRARRAGARILIPADEISRFLSHP